MTTFTYYRTRPDGTELTVTGYPTLAQVRRGVALAITDNGLGIRGHATDFSRSLTLGTPAEFANNTFTITRENQK